MQLSIDNPCFYPTCGLIIMLTGVMVDAWTRFSHMTLPSILRARSQRSSEDQGRRCGKVSEGIYCTTKSHNRPRNITSVVLGSSAQCYPAKKKRFRWLYLFVNGGIWQYWRRKSLQSRNFALWAKLSPVANCCSLLASTVGAFSAFKISDLLFKTRNDTDCKCETNVREDNW